MPVKLLNCALPIIKGLYDILFVCCSHGFYLLCCRSYCGTLVQLYSSSIAAVFTFTIPKTLFGSTAQDLSLSRPLGNFINLCVCFILFFFQAETAPESGRDGPNVQISSGQNNSDPAGSGGSVASQSLVAPTGVSAGTSAAASFFIR